MAPKAALEERDNHMAFTRAKLVRRMESGKERPDLVEGLLKKQDEWVSQPSPFPSLRHQLLRPSLPPYLPTYL